MLGGACVICNCHSVRGSWSLATGMMKSSIHLSSSIVSGGRASLLQLQVQKDPWSAAQASKKRAVVCEWRRSVASESRKKASGCAHSNEGKR